jgi:hypothetical protein
MIARFGRDAAGQALAVDTLVTKETRSVFVVPPSEQFLGWQPIWSPDERQLAVITWVPGASVGQNTFWLNVVDVPAAKMSLRQPVPPDTMARFPYSLAPKDKLRWSPDGRKILISWGNAVVVDAETGSVESISRTPVVAEWAPSDKGVYYIGLWLL